MHEHPCGPDWFGPHHHGPLHKPFIDHGAPDCDDQLAIFSKVGRGPKGNGFKVVIKSDDDAETYLEGLTVDPDTGEEVSSWVTENINGGSLRYQYRFYNNTDPKMFTITFSYIRPGRREWHWTTPLIPYVWSEDLDPSLLIGGDVATLYVKKTTEEDWTEMLVYPEGFDHESMNMPDQGEPWTVNLEYGIGGDIDAPSVDDLASILGIPATTLVAMVTDGATVPLYYQQKYGDQLLVNTPDLKAYIDARCDDLDHGIEEAAAAGAMTAMQNLVDKIVGGGTVNSDGTITWPADSPIYAGGKIAAGNLNVYGADDRSKFIKTHTDIANDDVWAR